MSTTTSYKPLTKSDIKWMQSTHSSGGITNLGGPRHATEEASDDILHAVYDKVSNEHAKSGITKFRCLYIYNSNKKEWIKNPIAIVISNTKSSNDDASVGWGTAKIGPNIDDEASEEQEILDQHTPPDGVHFFNGNTRATGAILGADIAPLTGKALWLRIIVDNDAAPTPYNGFTIRLLADNLKVDDENITPPTGNPIPPTITWPSFGEFEINEWIKALLDKIFKRNPNFYLTLGNNTSTGNGASWLSLFDRVMPRVMMGFGAQDIITPSLRNQYINRISPLKFTPLITRGYYSKDVGNVHVLMMDTSGNVPYTNPSPQYTFVESDLRKAFLDPKIDWIIVETNKAMYASQTSTATRYLYGDLRDTYHQLFTQYGVIAVKEATFRNYQRSKVLSYNAGTPTAPTTFDYDYTDDNRTYTITSGKGFPDGQIYFVVGSAGAGHDVISSPASYTLQYNHIDYGYLWSQVDNTNEDGSKKIEFRFYSLAQKLIDHVTIVKPAPEIELEDAEDDDPDG
jgi:hypothetical protein